MDSEGLQKYFQAIWQSTIKGCMEKIHDREDKRTVRSIRSHDDILENLIDDPDNPLPGAVKNELSMISPRLWVLRDYSDDFANRLGPRLDPAIFWGLMGVMFTAAAQIQEISATQRITQMIKKLSRDVEMLRDYSAGLSILSDRQKEAIFDTFVTLTKFFSDTAQFLRDEEHFEGHTSPDHDPWGRLKGIFDLVSQEVEESLKVIEKRAALSDKDSKNMAWIHSIVSPAPRWADDATLPCLMLPPAGSSKFFDRDDVIDRIEYHLSQPSTQAFRSIALYGMAGVGKTHVAVKYAQERFAKHEVDAVLWVEGESEMKVKQSFTDIARQLRFPNLVPHNHDDNRLLVLNWLQNTKAKWLIIYDNVGRFDDIHAHWPSPVGRGHALITTRNTSLAYEPAETGIEVLPWDVNTGAKFLLHLLSGNISADILANQAQSALDLSERLSGHALALARMGGVIHRRTWTIKQLVEVYDRQPEFVNGIGPVWQLSFQNLNAYSSSLLSILSFYSSERVPEILLQPSNPESVSKELSWCSDMEKISQAMEELQTLSLIKKDRDDCTISIHQLIQHHFQEFLGMQGRQDAHASASKLVHYTFPPRAAHLYDNWELCALCVPHVIALKNALKREIKRNPNFRACREFCEVATTCERYLLEQHEFEELRDLSMANEQAILSLKGEDGLTDMLSSIPSYLGQMYLRTGYQQKGLNCLNRSLQLRLEEKDGDEMEISWAQHNIGEALITMGDFEAACAWLETAAETWKSWSAKSTGTGRRGFSPFQRITMAACLFYMGQIGEARRVLEPSRAEYMETATENWANASYATYLLGRIEMAEKRFSMAKSLFMQAQNIWVSGDKARTSFWNGAYMYRMGCCALELGNMDAAMNYMVGEHARCLYKLSQALSRENGREAEAEGMLQEAESLYFSRATDQGRTPTEIDYDGLGDTHNDADGLPQKDHLAAVGALVNGHHPAACGSIPIFVPVSPVFSTIRLSGFSFEAQNGLSVPRKVSTMGTMGDVDSSTASLIGNGFGKFTTFLTKRLNVRFVQLQWVDYTSTVRVRVVALRHFLALFRAGDHLALCRHYLCLIDIDFPFTDQDASNSAGQSHLIPDLDSVHGHPNYDEHIVVYCFFGDILPSPALAAETTLYRAEMCPRRALAQAAQAAITLGVCVQVGFELEFTCNRIGGGGNDSQPQVHQSSGLRAIESFMLPVLSEIAGALEKVDVPVQQFHCEGSENGYEIVTGPMSPLEAVDALATTKETARRICLNHNIALSFYPGPPQINGLHTTISIQNSQPSSELSERMESCFLAGILEHIGSLCAFAMVRPESYERAVDGMWCAGRYVAWGTENREVPIRKRKRGCWEMRLPDAAAQMYLYVAAVIIAGLSGIEKESELVIKDCRKAPGMISAEERLRYGITRELPSNPDQAFHSLLDDDIISGAIGKKLTSSYVAVQKEFNRRLEAVGPKGSEERRAWLAARI
ncbi:hypothetical protein O1611_g1504 [Lasiodiplodia mahajangana]|uniref:Uncharacterized protein n=1 Tax=Lasiodiplodia mahajangana TaxID=1108764 RepID=A0ACC2JXH4_9PEZI|nr:hypothetical protein O1611_g1504 [Lasiodiplodia mahajangana]